jgi:hypothetical protein
MKSLFADSTRQYCDALKADPKLADDRQAQHPYNAACAAALAAAGQGKDEPPLDDAARTKHRQQALGWLTTELAIWSTEIASATPVRRTAAAQALQHWLEDGDLAGIRDPVGIARLPEAERKAWAALWANVTELLKKARGDRR